MSESRKNPEENVLSDHMVALVQKACNNLAVLATSVDEINSLKRLTFLMELQKSWESKTDILGHERNEDRHQSQQQSRDEEKGDNITDIVICHDCGRSDLSTVQKSSRSYACHQCGLSFNKCLTLMRHLLTHNAGSHGGMDSGNGRHGNVVDAGSSSSQAKDFYIFMNSSNGKEAGSDMNVKLESNYGNMYDEEDEEEEEEEDDDYNENGDDEDDDDDEYSRDSEGPKKSASLQGRKIRTGVDSETSNDLKKEESNGNGVQSNDNDDYENNAGGQKGTAAKSKSQLATSRYSFFPKLECPACGRHFRRTNSLKNHMAIHTSLGPFFSHAQRNVSSNHGGRYKRSRSPMDGEDRPALCCDCGKQFVNLKRLKIHALSHSAPERYSCNKCPLKFSVAASLKRHLQRHSGIRPHVCSKCGKSFVRSDELTAHERLHSNRNRFPCPVCGKGFTRSIDMVRHQSCHETTKPYQCNQCEKSFVRHDFLKKHESTHLSRACPFCKDVFENRRNITLHIKKEHPDKSVEDLYNISQSKLTINSEAYNEAQSIVSILEPNNLYEVPRGSLQIELSPLVDEGISPSASSANSHQLGGRPTEREEEFS